MNKVLGSRQAIFSSEEMMTMFTGRFRMPGLPLAGIISMLLRPMIFLTNRADRFALRLWFLIATIFSGSDLYLANPHGVGVSFIPNNYYFLPAESTTFSFLLSAPYGGAIQLFGCSLIIFSITTQAAQRHPAARSPP
ncbi:hypothetical protein RCH14_003360 [Massilia sp. MP_M2]|uniref:hypothetical protein n=1 Tax=Massilia sp. MP_M2 TaxID=3071713 RepID=UPI00319E5F2B